LEEDKKVIESLMEYKEFEKKYEENFKEKDNLENNSAEEKIKD
jgi:hypothetical protein